MVKSFSERYGVLVPEKEITIREDAPEHMRDYLFLLMRRHAIPLRKLREIVCAVLREAPDRGNWSENMYMESEVQSLMNNCDWNKIYDIIEAFYSALNLAQKEDFSNEINAYFREKGIGWKMADGLIEARGQEDFEEAVKEVVTELGKKNLSTAKTEIKEALQDLSRRPTPDLTGSIQHSLAALECVSREVVGNKKATLGELINKNPNIVPPPLNDVISKIWGYSSEQGRHLREGRDPQYDEAELMVHLSATLCTYLSKKHMQLNGVNPFDI